MKHRKTQPEKRFRLVKDDDGHSYVIPAGLLKEFHAWVEAAADEYEGYTGPSFEDFALSYHPSAYTFTDWKEDRKEN